MRRLLIAVLGSLLGVVLIAPAAQGVPGVKTLKLEGQFAGEPTAPVQMKIDYLIEHHVHTLAPGQPADPSQEVLIAVVDRHRAEPLDRCHVVGRTDTRG